VREIRLHGSEGGRTETNRSLLPLSTKILGFPSGAGLRARRCSAKNYFLYATPCRCSAASGNASLSNVASHSPLVTHAEGVANIFLISVLSSEIGIVTQGKGHCRRSAKQHSVAASVVLGRFEGNGENTANFKDLASSAGKGATRDNGCR